MNNITHWQSFLADLLTHPRPGRLKFHANFGGADSHGLISGCKGSFEVNYNVYSEFFWNSNSCGCEGMNEVYEKEKYLLLDSDGA